MDNEITINGEIYIKKSSLNQKDSNLLQNACPIGVMFNEKRIKKPNRLMNDYDFCEEVERYGNLVRGNLGYRNTGKSNMGDKNTGNSNVGNNNVGNNNIGDSNVGSCNIGNGCQGFLNTKPTILYFFNKPIKENCNFDLLPELFEGFDISFTGDEEKDKKLLKKTLRKRILTSLKSNPSLREKILSLPNFDYVVFEEITGITSKELEVDFFKKRNKI